ncbi:ribonuclease HII [candidate division KSB1 bacterium]|nr:ribonuclease HII [candidate division KSB1 bacterium]MCH8955898.1 ribonuclease HII [candidate division KSB1 bacterium]MCH8980422.1 ribonuclease HII [candidate division KSB1 bacterium]
MLRYERNLWNEGKKYVAGLDEAGRGPLAGPVVAAAVVFYENPQISMINDSKKLTEEIREYLFDLILNETLCGIGAAEVGEIDRINIYQASFLAMDRALENLDTQPEHLLVDGRAFPRNDIPFTTIVKGDSISYSVAAASILAKVTRDRMMREYDQEFPQYGFANHKGYATREHLDAIEEFGYCPIHRRSFHPKRFQLELDFSD